MEKQKAERKKQKEKSRNSKENNRLLLFLSTPSATRSVARPSSKRDSYIAYTKSQQNTYPITTYYPTRDSYIALLFNPLNICKILPRRRGSGSDVVADEGVETSGKAESRKKKAEIAKRIIACYEYLSTPSALVIRLMLVPLRRGTTILLIQNPNKTHPCTPRGGNS